MDKSSRRQAIRDYKERKAQAAVFAIRCAASGETWVAGAANLESQQTRYWFGLRTGGHINRGMQAAWTAHGEESFSFEVLERLEDEDLTSLGRTDLIKARERHWLATLAARKAAG
jgi:hypothetical protein